MNRFGEGHEAFGEHVLFVPDERQIAHRFKEALFEGFLVVSDSGEAECLHPQFQFSTLTTEHLALGVGHGQAFGEGVNRFLV